MQDSWQEILVSVLLGLIVGIIFSKLMLLSPVRESDTMKIALKRYGLGGGFAIGSPMLAYMTILRDTSNIQLCMLFYLTSLITTAVLFTLAAGLLMTKSIPPNVMDRRVRASYNWMLIRKLLIEGYTEADKHMAGFEEILKRAISGKSSANEDYDELLRGPDTNERAWVRTSGFTRSQFEQMYANIKNSFEAGNLGASSKNKQSDSQKDDPS